MKEVKNVAQLNIQRDEKEFFSFMDALPYGVFLIDTNRKVYFANTLAKKMTGNPNLTQVHCSNIFTSIEGCDLSFPEVGETHVSRTNIRHKDRCLIPVLKTSQPIVFNFKNYFLDVVTDNREQVATEKALLEKTRELNNIIAEKHEAEQKARQEAQKFETLFEEVPDAVMVNDFDGHFLRVNSKGCQRLGYSRVELEAMNLSQVISKEDQEQKENLLHQLMKGNSMLFEAVNISKSGERIPVEVFAKKIDFEGQPAILSSVRNITDRKQYEKELIDAKRKAEEADRLKSQFLHNISHEVRTPLNGIIGFLDLLADEQLPPDQKAEILDIMRQSSDRLIETVTDIVEMSKIQTCLPELKKERFSISEELALLEKEVRSLYSNKDVKLAWTYASGLKDLQMETDREYFKQIILQLISNAFKFTTEGTVSVNIAVDDDQLRITVADTGVGIPKGELAKIFQPFHKTPDTIKNAIDGNGLGLALAKNRANAMGGNISVASQYGQGATFRLVLPGLLKAEKPEKAEPVSENALKDKTILVVEDEQSNYLYLEAVLRKKGCKVLHALNGAQAVKMGLNGHKVDLILMDLSMPVMDGFTATQKIREKNKEVPIIAHSAFVLNNEKAFALQSGCNDFLAKPVKQEDLIAVMLKRLT
jgi:PAS domain S-box-containing protein